MQTMERIYRYRMTTTSGGNISLRDDNGDVWITPARVDKGSLGRGDIVCVRPDGTVEGPHRASSEFPFHQAIYAARPELRGIVHAHSVGLVAFSISGRTPDTRVFHKAFEICGNVGFAPYALPGSAELGRNIAAVFAQGFDAVVLENHGVVVGGETLAAAFQRFETLEFTAQTIIGAGLLGEVRSLSDAQLEIPRSLPPLPVGEVVPPTSREKEIRRQLCEFIRRGYRQRLLISTEGSFSARLDDASFLITPGRVDRSSIELDEIVLIRGGQAEPGKTPSRAARLHGAIYRRHPDITAIVNACPVNATAFSITQDPLEARTIPEAYLLLRDVQRIPYGMTFAEPDEVARRVSPEQPVALLDNDGVLVCGTDVLDAFDRLEVLECTAEALINSRPLGEVRRMPDAVIDDLRRAFLK